MCLASASRWYTSSGVHVTYGSHIMALFRGFGSRQIRSFLLPSLTDSTITKLFIHGVASWTSAMMPEAFHQVVF